MLVSPRKAIPARYRAARFCCYRGGGATAPAILLAPPNQQRSERQATPPRRPSVEKVDSEVVPEVRPRHERELPRVEPLRSEVTPDDDELPQVLEPHEREP